MTVTRSMSAHPRSRRLPAVRGTLTAAGSPPLARVLAAFLALHGVAHFGGTSDLFSKATDGGAVEYLAGAWTVSDPTLLRLLGIVWVLVGVAFILVAVLTWMRWPWWPGALAGVSAVSLVVVMVALWASVVGVLIDVGLLVVAWRARGVRHEGGGR